MSRLEELQRAFGGRIQVEDQRSWLDTRIGGLRVWIARREHGGGQRYELAVFTPEARELAPFANTARMPEWRLESLHTIPRLQHGFVFAGCRSGVLLATHGGEPALGDLVATLWELGRWARETWVPSEAESHFTRDNRQRRRARIELAKRLAIVAFVVLVACLLRRPASDGRAIADAIPCARLVVVEGMGHDLPRAPWPRFVDEIVRHVALAEKITHQAGQATM